MPTRTLTSFLPRLMIVLAFSAAVTAAAQIPQTINYQGYLTNSGSQPVNAAVNVTFRLYTAASGGTPVWSETQSGVGVTNGIYNAVLGSVAPLALPFNVPYFLSLQVNSDAEMAARQPLSAVPYALRAVSAETVAAGASIPAAQITGTLASSQFAATQLLPTTACTANQFSQWNGTAWICAAGTGTTNTSEVTGNLTMVNSTAKAGNILKGGTRFIHNFGSGNTFIGEGAGTLALTGMNNTATGFSALGANTFGQSNTAIGAAALFSNTGGYDNTASGAGALNGNVDGAGNTAIGSQALVGNVSGGDNTAIGKGALKFSSGNNNIGIGADAGSASETGSNNIAIGNAAQVADSGVVRIGTAGMHAKAFVAGILGVTPGVAGALPVVIDSNGQLGTGAAGGGVTSITAGAGLTGGTITGSGTIAIDPASSVLTGNYLKLGGNNTPSTAIIGTTNESGFQINVNNLRVLYVEGYGINNITFGHPDNAAGYLYSNLAFGATVSGGGTAGYPNIARGSYSTIAGGSGNAASNYHATVSGGFLNSVGGQHSTVGGGRENTTATAQFATVSGGNYNNAIGGYAAVGGGVSNIASGLAASVPGGWGNEAVGNYSFAAGHRAKANSPGCFAWADSLDADFVCTTNDTFLVRATGGVKFYTNAALGNGCTLAPGGGAWSCTSSRETKTDFTSLNPIDVLSRVMKLPMTNWRYRAEESGARHVGPMAEDFYAAFGLGGSNKSIGVLDASGVALTAIQGLHHMVMDKDREIATLKRDLDAIKKKLGLD